MAIRRLLLVGRTKRRHHRPVGPHLLHRLRRGLLRVPAPLRLRVHVRVGPQQHPLPDLDRGHSAVHGVQLHVDSEQKKADASNLKDVKSWTLFLQFFFKWLGQFYVKIFFCDLHFLHGSMEIFFCLEEYNSFYFVNRKLLALEAD